MQLQIKAVLQPQRLELVLGQFTGETARHLVAELIDAGIDDRLVILVVTVHFRSPSSKLQARCRAPDRAAQLARGSGYGLLYEPDANPGESEPPSYHKDRSPAVRFPWPRASNRQARPPS